MKIMFKKLTEKDRESVLEYLYLEPSLNIFLIGDIENYGFDVDFQEVYAELDNEVYLSVVLRYRENVLYYSHQTMFNTDWLELINTFKFDFVSGRKALTDLLIPHFPEFKEKPMYFCEVNKLQENHSVDLTNVIDVKSSVDITSMFHLLKKINEFDGMDKETLERFTESKVEALQHSKSYNIDIDGKCVCTVSTVADTKKAAMVIAVATDKDYRKKGYASQLMNVLLDEYLNNRKKSLCLFYDNPQAGKIYHRLGFVDVDMWVMLVRK